MATVSFSPNIRSQVDIGETAASGGTLAEAMAELFAECPALKSYNVRGRPTISGCNITAVFSVRGLGRMDGNRSKT